MSRAFLNVLIPDGEPPSEVRLFARGNNTTSKGTFLFDDAAAKSVMAAYEQASKDVMLDLEHLSLNTESRSFDPDARGWAKLEVRSGELWLTDISWNEDGAARLRAKKQRYLSPVFDYDPRTQRVLSVKNVAITAMPATHNPQPLVAANERGTDVMKSAICKLLNMAEETPDEEVLKALAARLADAMPADMPPEEKKDMPALRAITLAARKATGKTTAVEVEASLAALSQARTSVTDLTAEVATLRASTMSVQLRELCRANPTKIASTASEAYVMKCSSIEAAQAYIDTLPAVVKPAVEQKKIEGGDEVTLTDADREACKLTGQSPAKILEYMKKQAALRAV